MSAHNSRHGTTSSISSRNTCRRVFFVYRSKPFIVARLLCCLFVDLIWRNLLYIPVERETLFRVSLALAGLGPEFLAKPLAESIGHRVQVSGEGEAPLFRRLLCQFLELLRNRLHRLLALSLERSRT